jgi:hypothetical protein
VRRATTAEDLVAVIAASLGLIGRPCGADLLELALQAAIDIADQALHADCLFRLTVGMAWGHLCGPGRIPSRLLVVRESGIFSQTSALRVSSYRRPIYRTLYARR